MFQSVKNIAFPRHLSRPSMSLYHVNEVNVISTCLYHNNLKYLFRCVISAIKGEKMSGTFKRRVCVIGCGPSGMSMLFELGKLPDDQIPDIVCYEKQETVGGLWNFTWRTGQVHL